LEETELKYKEIPCDLRLGEREIIQRDKEGEKRGQIPGIQRREKCTGTWYLYSTLYLLTGKLQQERDTQESKKHGECGE